MFGLSYIVVIPVAYMLPSKYAHPELLGKDPDHIPFLSLTGQDRAGKVNGMLLRSYQKYANVILGQPVTDEILKQVGLPTRVILFKKYPLAEFLNFVENIEDKRSELKSLPGGFHEAALEYYLARTRTRGMLKFIGRKKAIDGVVSFYHIYSNKGCLVLVKMTDERAIINYYIESKYNKLIELVLAVLRVDMKLFKEPSIVSYSKLRKIKNFDIFQIKIEFNQ